MRRNIVVMMLLLLAMGASAQQLKIGYFSYDGTLTAMPQYIEAQANIDKLRQQYAAEMQRAEDEFNKKYEEFLDGQRDFAPSILQKRQTELQELMSRNVKFKSEAARLLSEAEQQAVTPLRQKLDEAARQVGANGGYTLILNTDHQAVPYTDGAVCEDVSEQINRLLR
ncbi:MAG: OmpH family outer membrane protein [Prevotella sp.]|nr:OmpH family outer membrane protein [Prevotella sp.]